MRGDHLPRAFVFQPHVGKAVVVLIHLSVLPSLFVLGPHDHRGVAVHVNFQIGEFGDVDVY